MLCFEILHLKTSIGSWLASKYALFTNFLNQSNRSNYSSQTHQSHPNSASLLTFSSIFYFYFLLNKFSLAFKDKLNSSYSAKSLLSSQILRGKYMSQEFGSYLCSIMLSKHILHIISYNPHKIPMKKALSVIPLCTESSVQLSHLSIL